jgi:hypothetical protein
MFQFLSCLLHRVPRYVIILDFGVPVSEADSLLFLICFAHVHLSSHFDQAIQFLRHIYHPSPRCSLLICHPPQDTPLNNSIHCAKDCAIHRSPVLRKIARIRLFPYLNGNPSSFETRHGVFCTASCCCLFGNSHASCLSEWAGRVMHPTEVDRSRPLPISPEADDCETKCRGGHHPQHPSHGLPDFIQAE